MVDADVVDLVMCTSSHFECASTMMQERLSHGGCNQWQAFHEMLLVCQTNRKTLPVVPLHSWGGGGNPHVKLGTNNKCVLSVNVVSYHPFVWVFQSIL